MINIRDFELNDLDRVMEIENLTFKAPWKKEEMLYEINGNEFSHLGVIELDGRVVGFYDFWITFDSATIAQIAVDPLFHRQGLASRMMEEIIKECQIKKVRNVTLEVRENNEKAVKMYAKFRFKTLLKKEKYYSNGDNALYMVREITNNG